MIKTISAIILFGLIIYTQVRKMLAKRGGEEMRCASCGRLVVERPVKKEMDGKELVFCCEHCAAAYVKREERAEK